MLDWRIVASFPTYSVSNSGKIRSELTDRILVPGSNQFGVVHVRFNQDGRQYCRALALIVACAWLDIPPSDSWNSVINLDGDRFNNRVDNIAWRPRWFAKQYSSQFTVPRHDKVIPVVELTTGKEFANTWDAAKEFGLLEFDIRMASREETLVWPTRHAFARI